MLQGICFAFVMLGDDDSASARGDNPHQEYYKHDGRYQNKDFTRKSDCI